jgi:hypothetical protein
MSATEGYGNAQTEPYLSWWSGRGLMCEIYHIYPAGGCRRAAAATEKLIQKIKDRRKMGFLRRLSCTSQPQIIVDRNCQVLLRTKISFRRLNGAMPKQKLDLFQVAAVLATELCAGPAQVVCAEVFDSNLLRRLLDDRPDRPVAQLVADQLPALGKRPQQTAVLDLGRDHPGVDSVLDPEWDCHRADSAALPTKIWQDPSALPHLDAVNVQTGQLLPPQSAAQQQRQKSRSPASL